MVKSSDRFLAQYIMTQNSHAISICWVKIVGYDDENIRIRPVNLITFLIAELCNFCFSL